MSRRGAVSLLLAAVLLTISPLAYSEIADAVWLAGYYDGGDEDVALANLELLHLSATEVLVVDPSPSVAFVQLPPPSSEKVAPDRTFPATQPRAPPIA